MYLCCYSEQAVEQTLDWPVIWNTMTVIDVAVTPPPELGISGPVVAYLWWYARHYSVLFADGRTRMMDISSSVAEEKVDRNAQGVILSRVRILPFEHALNFLVISSRINGIFSAKKSANRFTNSVTFANVDKKGAAFRTCSEPGGKQGQHVYEAGELVDWKPALSSLIQVVLVFLSGPPTTMFHCCVI